MPQNPPDPTAILDDALDGTLTKESARELLQCFWVKFNNQPAPPKVGVTAAEVSATINGADTVWVLVCGMLVFFMNLGFAMVESGLCRVKNTVNILAKNFIVFAVSSLAYYVLGFGIMYGDGNGLLGLQGLLALLG